eukprot:2026208-Alexandrium_andersonii.AAC.1
MDVPPHVRWWKSGTIHGRRMRHSWIISGTACQLPAQLEHSQLMQPRAQARTRGLTSTHTC